MTVPSGTSPSAVGSEMWHRVGAAALAGLLATIALAFSPLIAATPPIVPPYVPIDLRFVVLPLAFAGLQALAEQGSWPTPAVTVLSASVLTAIAANLSASQVLAYLGVPWARGGMQVDLAAFAASLAAVLAGLWIALHIARETFRDRLTERGVPEEELTGVLAQAGERSRDAIAIAGIGAGGLALVARLVGTGLGDSAVPFPELVAIGMVLAAGALLLGLPRRETGTQAD